VKAVNPGSILYNISDDISIESFKKVIDKLCISGIIIKTSLKMMHIMNVLGLATK
jgi:hypothetical protein